MASTWLKLLPVFAASATSFTMAVHTEIRPHAEHRQVAVRHHHSTGAKVGEAAAAAAAGGVAAGYAGYAANEFLGKSIFQTISDSFSGNDDDDSTQTSSEVDSGNDDDDSAQTSSEVDCDMQPIVQSVKTLATGKADNSLNQLSIWVFPELMAVSTTKSDELFGPLCFEGVLATTPESDCSPSTSAFVSEQNWNYLRSNLLTTFSAQVNLDLVVYYDSSTDTENTEILTKIQNKVTGESESDCAINQADVASLHFDIFNFEVENSADGFTVTANLAQRIPLDPETNQPYNLPVPETNTLADVVTWLAQFVCANGSEYDKHFHEDFVNPYSSCPPAVVTDTGTGDTCAVQLQEAINDVLANPPDIDSDGDGEIDSIPFTFFLSGDLTQLGWGELGSPYPPDPTSISCANSVVSIPWANMLTASNQNLVIYVYIDVNEQHEGVDDFWATGAPAGYHGLQFSYISSSGKVSGAYGIFSEGGTTLDPCVDLTILYSIADFVEALNACP